ncbi:phosphotriesterase-related protein [Enterovibrio sp. ZSDZ35]|uniref:Phosphotriesterase-related protein n=1 Tax=Enterovibrio qingdaonensis TaxID=2899818 RepID=A0ABT5QNV1_9GAMM|nr:phosphotriesterase-related protein [Enterovibrio sp. ZSDZ35]MDD1782664.1 phosphotriesterase-related protein [Enterovibrio sp. ZSDZ35]
MPIYNDGYTYCHEHLYIDLSEQKRDIDCKLDQYTLICEEMNNLVSRGVFNIVEVTNRYMGRNPHFIECLMRDSGINILLSTGYYIEGFFPSDLYEKSAEDIRDEMIKEIEIGIDGSAIKASLIGEIGSSENVFSDTEKKVFKAAAMAQYETGTPISTHLSFSTMGKEQIAYLKQCGADLSRVTIGHCDLRNDLDQMLWIIDQGCYVQFDTIGKNSYFPDEKRIDMLEALANRDLLSQVMLSMDITRRSHLKKNGGPGFLYLIDEFLPKLLERGFSQQQIDTMLRHNPYTLFN